MTFVTEKPPPEGRVSKTDGHMERHLHEAAVMLAVAQWMFGTVASAWTPPDDYRVMIQYVDKQGEGEND